MFQIEMAHMFTSQTAIQLLPKAIPELIRNSPLMGKGGFDVFVGLLDDHDHAQMLAEAINLFTTASVNEVLTADNEDGRGGNPPRSYLVAPGGPIQDAFYHSDRLLSVLQQVTGTPLVQTGIRGTYSYYVRPGDYLALHRDIVTCDVAVITCLNEGPNVVGASGMLCLYPDRIYEPLSVIRESLEEKVVGVRLMAKQTIVLFGGIVPHMLLPVAEQQIRIISVLCYRIPLPANSG
jgi:hypothetical protein